MVASWVSQASFTPPGITVAVAKDRAVEALLHKGDRFALNVLAEGRETAQMKQFLQPFAPGADRFAGLELQESPGDQPLLPEALAWLEGSVKQRMECGDHWLVYAQVLHGGLFDPAGSTAVSYTHLTLPITPPGLLRSPAARRVPRAETIGVGAWPPRVGDPIRTASAC